MKAIVYTSNAGHSAAYAKLLGGKTGLPVYELGEAIQKLPKGTQIIYLGWLFVNNVKGYRKAAKRFSVAAVCGVGLCDTGTAIDGVRKANKLPDTLPLFTMQGGMDKTQLGGIYGYMIKMLIKMTEAKQEKTEDDARMLYLLKNDKNYVSEENAASFMQWYEEHT